MEFGKRFTSRQSVFLFSIAIKTRILIFLSFFVFVWNLENGLQVVFLFLVYGIETDNLYFGGNIKESKMAALEDVLDRDFVRRPLVEQKHP